MPTKRKHGYSGSLDGAHTSRKAAQLQSSSTPRPRKRARKSAAATQTAVPSKSINPLKKRIRDVSRLLERSQALAADARVENERALAAYRHELATAMEERSRQKTIKKYHMVRFFGTYLK